MRKKHENQQKKQLLRLINYYDIKMKKRNTIHNIRD